MEFIRFFGLTNFINFRTISSAFPYLISANEVAVTVKQ